MKIIRLYDIQGKTNVYVNTNNNVDNGIIADENAAGGNIGGGAVGGTVTAGEILHHRFRGAVPSAGQRAGAQQTAASAQQEQQNDGDAYA